MQRMIVSTTVMLCACLCLAGCDSNAKTKTYRRGDAGKYLKEFEAKQDRKFVSLALADFDVFHAKPPKPSEPPTWTEKDGVISCTGRPDGYLYSKKVYRNFELTFEYRFERPKQRADYAKLNTGCLIFIQGEHRRWPVCLEVQGKWLEVGAIKSNARHIKLATSDDKRVRTETRSEPGNWMAIRIVTRDGLVTAAINGQTIAVSEPTELKSGLIGFQSEGSRVEFRNIRIRVQPDAKAKGKKS